MKFTISRNELRAAMIFASKDDTRFTLCGVLVEVDPLKHAKPLLVSTDGRELAVIESIAEQPAQVGVGSFLFSSDFLKPIAALSKTIGGKIYPWIEFDVTEMSKACAIELVGRDCRLEVAQGALIEGEFPMWRRVLPSKKALRQPLNDLAINSELMANFAKAAKELNANPVLQMNLISEESGIEVRITASLQFYGLIMPCKTDKETEYQPEFLGIIKDLPTIEKEEKPETDEV